MITKKQILNKRFNIINLMNEQDEEDYEIDMDPEMSNEFESNETTSDDFVTLASILLHSQTQVHTLHLQTESYSEHKALQGYYEGIDGLVDGLVESYQGKYGILKGYETMDLNDWESTEQTIKYLKNLCSEVENLRDCCEDSYIQNQIDTICELINSTLYKLRFLK
jgi:hypothetical protein